MGKRKVQKNPKQSAPTGVEQSKGKSEDVVKGKKTYSLQASGRKDADGEDISDLPKVHLPDKLENALIELIVDEQKTRQSLGDMSKRITSKKLTDVYNSLSDAGFSKNQVEAAMSSTIMCGGDLIDALDWLCLNTQNDQLPAGFSETLQKEEEKHRPKFDRSLLVEFVPAKDGGDSGNEESKALSTKSQNTPRESSIKDEPSMKDWILQYAEQSSSDDEQEGEDEEASFDPTTRYAQLYEEMQELKDQAAIAKSNGATEQHKQLSKQLREIHLEMASHEKSPEFDKSIKTTLRASASSSRSKPVKKSGASQTVQTEAAASKDEGEEDLGFSLFAEAEKAVVPKPSVVEKVQEDVRSFEYTRSQWTGKSPKQFLIDWVRKHLPKSGPPKFRKIQVKVNRFKSTAVVDRQKDGELAVTPDILCENVKEAEHLAATLALYHLCKGQPVHQLLPPPYRNVWLDWADEEKREKDEVKEKENKPRDQFISKLMKKLNIDDGSNKTPRQDTKNGKGQAAASREDDDEDEDDWESLADKGQLEEVGPNQSQRRNPRHPGTAKSDNSKLHKALQERHATKEFQELLVTRQQLPVYQYREKIVEAVREHNVVVVAGETGSGKSTQVPQFILESCVERCQDNVHIVCTQPRRISAVSLSTRVAEEMGEAGIDAKEALVGIGDCVH